MAWNRSNVFFLENLNNFRYLAKKTFDSVTGGAGIWTSKAVLFPLYGIGVLTLQYYPIRGFGSSNAEKYDVRSHC